VAISPVFGIVSSGLAFETKRLEVSANNVANVTTPGFVPSQVVGQEAPGGGVSGFVQPLTGNFAFDPIFTEALPSGTSLIQEAATQITALAAYKAQIAVFRTEDEILNSVVNMRT